MLKDRVVRRLLAATIPLTFVLVIAGAFVRDRVLDPVLTGGLIAILGAVVALFGAEKKDKDES